MPLYPDNYNLGRKRFKTPPAPAPPHTLTFPVLSSHRAGAAGKGVEWNARGVVVLWVEGGIGGGQCHQPSSIIWDRIWVME